MADPLLNDLRRVQIRASGEMMAALEKARKNVAAKARAMTPAQVGNEAFRRAFYGRIGSVYQLLDKELTAILQNSTRDTVELTRVAAVQKIRKVAKGKAAAGLALKFDPDRMRRYMEFIQPENGPSIAAVFTEKMSQEDREALRGAVLKSLRQAELEGWTARERIKGIQAAWDTAAGDLSGNRFVDRAGREWDNARYLQMMVRTTQSRLSREASIDTIVENGDDLMRIQTAGDNCPACQAWSGVIVSVTGTNEKYPSYDDALDGGVFHPNCLPGDALVSACGVLGAFRFRFVGDLVRIVLAGGGTLRIAPNHPVLTASGWVAAKDVKQGDKVFSTGHGKRMHGGTPNVNDAPSRIDEVFMAFAKAGGVSSGQMPIAPEHFHGDGMLGQGNVDVVWSDRALLIDREPSGPDGVGKLLFRTADVGMPNATGSGHFGALLKRVGLATDRRMSSLCPLHASIWGGCGVPSGEPFARASQGDSGTLDDAGKPLATYAGGFPDSEDVFAGLVAADDVLRIDLERFDGHLYDLLTVEGCYLAGDENAIAIVSNCDCMLARADETTDAAAIEKQADAKNPGDWTDLDAVAEYRERAGLPPPRENENELPDFSTEAAKAYARERKK